MPITVLGGGPPPIPTVSDPLNSRLSFAVDTETPVWWVARPTEDLGQNLLKYQVGPGSAIAESDENIYHSFIDTKFMGTKDLPRKHFGVDHEAELVAFLVPSQKAVHVYDIAQGQRDLVKTLCDPLLEKGVCLDIHNGRVDVLLREDPFFYSFNLDDSAFAAPPEFCRTAARSKVVFPYPEDSIRSRARLIDDDTVMRSTVVLDLPVNDRSLRSTVTFEDRIFEYWDKLSALGDYLLVGNFSSAASTLFLIDRSDWLSVWNKELRSLPASYTNGLVEPMVTRNGVNYIETTSYYTELHRVVYDLDLFDTFGAIRIGLARSGSIYTTSWQRATILEEYDINLGDGRSVIAPIIHASAPLKPWGMYFKTLDASDTWPGMTGTYLCYCRLNNMLQLHNRVAADTNYTLVGSKGFPAPGWLVTRTLEVVCPLVRSTVRINEDFSGLRSLANVMFQGLSAGLRSQVTWSAEQWFTFRSYVRFAEDCYLRARVPLDIDQWIQATATLVDNGMAQFWAAFTASYDSGIKIHRLTSSAAMLQRHDTSSTLISSIAPVVHERRVYSFHDVSGVKKLICQDLLTGNEIFSFALPKDPVFFPDGYPQHRFFYYPIYCQGRIVYLYYDLSGTDHGVAWAWADGSGGGYTPASRLLPGYEDIRSLGTDGTNIYALARKGENEGLWLVTFNAFLGKVAEVRITCVRTHTREDDDYVVSSFHENWQIQAWDAENEQFIISLAGVGSHGNTMENQYGPAVFGADGQLKWWKNYSPAGLIFAHLHRTGKVYLLPYDDTNHTLVTPQGHQVSLFDPGTAPDDLDLFYATGVELYIENAVRSKVRLVGNVPSDPTGLPAGMPPSAVPLVQKFVG